MKYELVITADTNDANYVTATHKIDDIKEWIVKYHELLQAIKENQGDWPYFDRDIESVHEAYPDFDLEFLEEFSDYVATGDRGCLTIESIVYYPLPEKVKLL